MSAVVDKDPNLLDLLRILDRRRSVVVATALTIFLLAVVACIITTRKYTAVGVVQLDKSSDSLGLDSLMGAAAGGASDALSVNIDLQTQADILKSESLSLKVIKDLNLEHNPDFAAHFNPIGWALGTLSPRGPADPPNAPLEDAPGRRSRLIAIFQDDLKVKVTAGTRLLEVDYVNSDPRVAAAVVNDLVKSLIDYTFQTKFRATSEISTWLEAQLGDLRKQSEDLQAKVVALQQQSGIFGVGGTDPGGKPVIYSPILDRLQQTTSGLSQAQMSRVMKGSIYQVVRNGDPETISQLSGTSLATASSPGVTNSLTLIQNLRVQESTLAAQVSQDLSQFGPAYPKLIQEKASLAGIRQSIKDESGRIAERARNDYEVAQKTEAGARAAYTQDERAAEKLNDKSIEYAILSKEADQSQELYQDLLRRLKEAGILEGLHSSNITSVDQATTPAKPSKPRVPIYLAIGLFGGLFFGVVAALLADAVDRKIRGIEEIERMQIPVLGLIPRAEGTTLSSGAMMLDSKFSAFNEAIRALRSTLLISRSDRPPQVLLVTSGSPAEGKSTIALNLAIALSQASKKVLLVEADMRRPVLRKRLGLKADVGLSYLLAGADSSAPIEALPDSPDIFILPAGPTPPYPAELLSSDRMRTLLAEWKSHYDFIVLDSPPVLPVSDSLALEEVADATVLVSRAGTTPRVGLQRSYNMLKLHSRHPENTGIGVILNYVTLSSAAYYGYYGYYGNKKYDYKADE